MGAKSPVLSGLSVEGNVLSGISAKSQPRTDLPGLLAIFGPNSTISFAGFQLNYACPARQHETFLHVWESALQHGTLLTSVLSATTNHAKSERVREGFHFAPCAAGNLRAKQYHTFLRVPRK